MRVLHVITALGTGGAETQLRMLLQHTRHEADVVSLYNPGAIATQLRDDGVRVVNVGMRGNRDLRAVSVLAGLIRSGRYDVVHTHLYRACLYGRLAARLAGAPRIVATEHSLFGGQLEGRRVTAPIRALYLATERLGDRTIVVSEAVRAELLGWGIPARRLVRVPNGLDLVALRFDADARARVRDEFGIPPQVTVVGAVGRLHPGKRYDELIEAAAPLLGRDRVLLFVGDGAQRAALVAQARLRGVESHVLFAGERPAAPLLSAMDVLAAPSSRETFGLAVMEALVNGLPVVYRCSPGLKELETAGLPAVQVGNSTAELRNALVGYAPRVTSPAQVPTVLAGLDIRRVASAIDDVYEGLERRSTRRRP